MALLNRQEEAALQLQLSDTEFRLDPSDGNPYTYAEFEEFYTADAPRLWGMAKPEPKAVRKERKRKAREELRTNEARLQHFWQSIDLDGSGTLRDRSDCHFRKKSYWI